MIVLRSYSIRTTVLPSAAIVPWVTDFAVNPSNSFAEASVALPVVPVLYSVCEFTSVYSSFSTFC